MDREQEELQFLGLFGIYKQSYKLILSRPKLFTQITISLIFPLSLIFLSHVHFSDSLLSLLGTEFTLYDDWSGDPTTYHHLRQQRFLSSKWKLFFSLILAYFLFSLLFSLLSTSAIVFTIASIFTTTTTHNKDTITFKRVMSVVPKVYKRVVITFLWNLVIMFVYNFAAITLLTVSLLLAGSRFEFPRNIGFFIVMISLLWGFVYINVVWHLASVVSVLEDQMDGLRAMMKSKGLIKGNALVAGALFVMFEVPIGGIQFGYEIFVVHGGFLGVGSRVVVGLVCFLVLVKLILLGLVVQSVVYFVCKSYHHERIDKSGLAEHLEGYYKGEYVPLRGKDVQLGELSIIDD